MTELPKPDEPISSDSKIGSEAADIIEEQLPPLPVDSMMEAFEENKRKHCFVGWKQTIIHRNN